MQGDLSGIISKLADAANGEVHTDRVLAPYTSYNIGGPTSVWVAPSTESGVSRVLKIIHHNKLPFFVLGRGSNLLISDTGWNGVTLYVAENLSGFLMLIDLHQKAFVADKQLQGIIDLRCVQFSGAQI